LITTIRCWEGTYVLTSTKNLQMIVEKEKEANSLEKEEES